MMLLILKQPKNSHNKKQRKESSCGQNSGEGL